MTPTLQTFIRALSAPDLQFKTLRTARPLTDGNALPQVHRTTRFAECEIVWEGKHWLLFMPMSPTAMAKAERIATALRKVQSQAVTEYRLLPAELMWRDDLGKAHYQDLVVEALPQGIGFTEALHSIEQGKLLAELEALEKELRKIKFTHHNLKPENLRWDGERFLTLRYHDAEIGGDATNEEAWESLRQRILKEASTEVSNCSANDVEGNYSSQATFNGHRWMSHAFEGLICVEDETGYGFIDEQGQSVIPSTFVWAGDFHEGRAEVETDSGMGLIDKEGRWIIPAEYEIVEYLADESLVKVRKDNRWAMFDYMGRQLSPFEEA